MTQPIHTPGPLHIRRASKPDNTGGVDYALAKEGSVEILAETFENVAWKDSKEKEFVGFPAEANARLLRASYNAFDSAGKKLECNAVELAERMQDGGVSDLVAALKLAEHAMSFVGQPGYTQTAEGIKAWAEELFLPAARAVLAKVKGGGI